MYTIRGVSQLLGVPPTTLRAWEQRYGGSRPPRSDGGYLDYDEWDAATRQETRWSGNTSGFGVSRPSGLDAAKAESTANWLKPATWVRRAAPARNS